MIRCFILLLIVTIPSLCWFMAPGLLRASDLGREDVAVIQLPGDCLEVDTTLGFLASSTIYRLDDRLCVRSGTTLSILPGTRVRFGSGARLIIYGQLIAEGEAQNPIIFESDSEVPSPRDDWGVEWSADQNSFSEEFSRNSRISWVVARHSAQAFTINASEVYFDNVTIEDVRSAIYADRSTFHLSDVQINRLSSDGVSMSNSTSTFSRVVIRDVPDGDAISIYDKSSIILDHVTVENVGRGSALGIYNSRAEVQDSVFSGGRDSGVEVYGNSFRGPSYLKMRNSAVLDFPSYALYSSPDVSGSVDAISNFWGDSSGPRHSDTNPYGTGGSVYGPATVAPWLKKDPRNRGVSNILFVPGFQASRLYAPSLGGLVEDQLWEPNRSGDVEKLFMDESGHSKQTDIYTKDIIDQINILGPGPNIYKGIIGLFDRMVKQGVVADWKPFPYDWRLSVEDVVLRSPIVELFQRLASTSDTGLVSIVAHSNGGLVAKQFLRTLDEMRQSGNSTLFDRIDKVLLVATPELGTPQAIASLLHGDKQALGAGVLLSAPTAKAFGENLPGAYGLLPSSEYFARVSRAPISFSVSAAEYFSKSGSVVLPVDSVIRLGQFLTSSSTREKPARDDLANPNLLSEGIFEAARHIHASLDLFLPPSIPFYRIIGTGIDTLKGIEYVTKRTCQPSTFQALLKKVRLCRSVTTLDHLPVLTFEGDGTVVRQSAEGAGRFNASSTDYYIDIGESNRSSGVLGIDRDHADITELSSVQGAIGEILSGNSPQNSSIQGLPSDQSLKKMVRVSVHSPVSLDLYDERGRHTGIATSSEQDFFVQIDRQIPGATYSEFGEGKYLHFPFPAPDAGNSLTVSIRGTGIGLFKLLISELQGDAVITTREFLDVPVTPFSSAEISFHSIDEITEISIDDNGDGQSDRKVLSGSGFDPIAYIESLRATLRLVCTSTAERDRVLEKIDHVLLRARAGAISDLQAKVLDNFIYAEGLSRTDLATAEYGSQFMSTTEDLLDLLE